LGEVAALQDEDHLVHRRSGDLEESLQAGFGRGLTCDAGVVDVIGPGGTSG
jgi:hypothetical protein